jgi:tetrahydromethanopterin S-methyltransferase subunit F
MDKSLRTAGIVVGLVFAGWILWILVGPLLLLSIDPR